MSVRIHQRISNSFVTKTVAILIVWGLTGYLVWSLVSKRPAIRIEETCALLQLDVAELKRKYLSNLFSYAREYVRDQEIPVVAVKTIGEAIVLELPDSMSRDEALSVGSKLNFPLLTSGAPGLELSYRTPNLTLAPTSAIINERLLASANANIEHLKSQYMSLGVGPPKIESIGRSRVLVRVPTEIATRVFSKTMGAHPVEASIRLFRSVEKVQGQTQAHERSQDTIQAGWFDPAHIYHLSRRSIAHEGQFASVQIVTLHSGAKLFRLYLQSDAVHRLRVAAESNPQGRVSLSVHDRVVSTIRVADIDSPVTVDFPGPANNNELRQILNDIQLSFAQSALKAENIGACD